MGRDVIERISLELLFDEKKPARASDRLKIKRVIIRGAILLCLLVDGFGIG